MGSINEMQLFSFREDICLETSFLLFKGQKSLLLQPMVIQPANEDGSQANSSLVGTDILKLQ